MTGDDNELVTEEWVRSVLPATGGSPGWIQGRHDGIDTLSVIVWDWFHCRNDLKIFAMRICGTLFTNSEDFRGTTRHELRLICRKFGVRLTEVAG